jgi:hypothetical protein
MRAGLVALIGVWQALPAAATDHQRMAGLMSDQRSGGE